ncbi:MAG: hypothetical protein H7251_08180 [Acetobacteraceae bacterium]|nr:hypothetical protein [Acetobacteraceae bacterium]
MIAARRIVALAALLLPLGCAEPVPSPAKLACAVTEDGFAPKRLTERGIGGTGAPIVLADRGIGGTGAKTGVQGVITGFASLCVNGLELDYDPADPIDVDGTIQVARDLRIGQMVTLRAESEAYGVVARAMAVRHVVSGPIDGIANGGSRLVVAGQDVRLGGNSSGAGSLEVGQWVEISGLRDPAGFILATRVDPRPSGEAIITGKVAGPPNARRIGGAALRGNLARVTSGDTVSLIGLYQDGVLTVRQPVATARPLPLGQAGLVVVEAIAQGTRTANGRPALQVGEDIVAAIGPNFGNIPANATLMVLVLEQAATGELTALSQHDGRLEGGSSAITTATPTTLAPHVATVTMVGSSAPKTGGGTSAKTEGAGSKGGSGAGGSSGHGGGRGASGPATK